MFLVLNDSESKTIQSTLDFTKQVAMFDWPVFFRVLIIIVVLAIIFFIVFFTIYRGYEKRRVKEKDEDDKKDSKLFEVVSDIPKIVRVFEKLNDTQRDMLFKVVGSISQERLKVICKRYISGFLQFCLHTEEYQLIEKEFDEMLSDIAKETVSPRAFSSFVIKSRVILDIIRDVQNKTLPETIYRSQKILEKVFELGVEEAVKSNKRVVFLEVAK